MLHFRQPKQSRFCSLRTMLQGDIYRTPWAKAVLEFTCCGFARSLDFPITTNKTHLHSRSHSRDLYGSSHNTSSITNLPSTLGSSHHTSPVAGVSSTNITSMLSIVYYSHGDGSAVITKVNRNSGGSIARILTRFLGASWC